MIILPSALETLRTAGLEGPKSSAEYRESAWIRHVHALAIRYRNGNVILSVEDRTMICQSFPLSIISSLPGRRVNAVVEDRLINGRAIVVKAAPLYFRQFENGENLAEACVIEADIPISCARLNWRSKCQ